MGDHPGGLILVVTGSTLRAEQMDRPLAYFLQKQIDELGDGHDERMALVQSPHDFFNHDSVQHYVVGRHEQSLFYRVVCPGKDRHGAAY